jgi:starvation-inducible DNA-binding protein
MAQAVRHARRTDGARRHNETESVELGIQDQGEVLHHLNRILADANVLYMKTKGYHWNVEGPMFFTLHKLLEEQYEALDQMIDVVGERTRALGGRPHGSFAAFLDDTRLKETDGKTFTAEEIVDELVADHEAVIRHLREDVDACRKAGDEGTMDLLTGFMRTHEKMAWMLRSVRGGPA